MSIDPQGHALPYEDGWSVLSEYHRGYRRTVSSEEELRLAVIEQAKYDFDFGVELVTGKRELSSKNGFNEKFAAFCDAVAWMLDDTYGHPHAFRSICADNNIDADAVIERLGVRRWAKYAKPHDWRESFQLQLFGVTVLECEQCGQSFERRSTNQRFCSRKCTDRKRHGAQKTGGAVAA